MSVFSEHRCFRNSFQCNDALSIRYAKLNIIITLIIFGHAGVLFLDKGRMDNCSQRGVHDKLNIFLWRCTPHISVKKGRLGCRLLRRGPVSPNTVPENKNRKGVRARYGLPVSWQGVRIAFGAVWGQRGHVPRHFPLCTPK